MAILTYHHIGECPPGQENHRGLFVSTELFRAHLAWLKDRGYVSVSLDAIADAISSKAPLPRRWVAITFDDGWRDNFTEAFPALREAGFSATIFLITNQVARARPSNQWDDYLTLADIKVMSAAGIEFGSHTHTHPRLTKLESGSNDTEAGTVMFELAESRRRMKEELGLMGDWFCYPYGNFAPRIAQLVRKAGYCGALSTIRDNRPASGQLFWMPRVMIMNDTDPKRLGYMLSPWYHWVHALKNKKRWKSLP